MFASLSDINFSIVDTKLGGFTGDDVFMKIGGEYWGLEGGT